MILKPLSYAGTSLQTSPYTTGFPREQASLQIATSPSYIKRAGAVPVYAGKDYTPHTLNIEVLVSSSPSFMSNFESLNQLFDTKDETPQQFICTDEEDSSKQYYVYATPQQVLGGHDGPMAVVTLALDDPIWQTVTQNSQTWSTTSSTSTTDVTNNGNDDAYPIFEITPTSSPSTDFIYSAFLQVLPTSTKPWASRPLCITGDTSTTWDTAALIAAGKMQADGDDIRVYRDGVEDNFWLGGLNTTDTRVWVVADVPEKREMTLRDAIGATDTVTSITIAYTQSNLASFSAVPMKGRLILDTSLGSTDTEEFTYTRKFPTDTSLVFTVSARARRGTVAVDHAAGSNVRFLPYDFRINYGNATATAPTVDDTHKPVLTLSTSNNQSFVYSIFADEDGLRAGSWKPFVRSQSDPIFSLSEHYTSTSDEGDTDPVTEMGLAAKTYQSGGLWRPDSVRLTWRGDFPDYITSFSASGEQNQTASSIPTFGMYYVNDVGKARSLWLVSAQASTDYGTWTTWSKATTDSTVPPNLDSIAWIVTGTILGATELYAKAGITAATINLTNAPHVMLRAEVATTVRINCRITNSTTGEYFDLLIPVEANDTLYVDTSPDFPNVSYNGQIVNGAIKLSSTRSAWLKLQPGLNTLTFDNSNSVANDFSIAIKHRDRQSFF
jgi:hypothetical protein